jgi:hypothetical protein
MQEAQLPELAAAAPRRAARQVAGEVLRPDKLLLADAAPDLARGKALRAAVAHRQVEADSAVAARSSRDTAEWALSRPLVRM